MSLLADLADARGRPWLAAVDPRLKLVWIAVLSLASVLVDTTPALVALVILAALPAAALVLRPKACIALGGVLLSIALGAVLTQAIFYLGEPRTLIVRVVPAFSVLGWKFPGIALYQEGALYGLVQSLRLVSLSLAGITVCISTSPERLLAAMANLRVPAAIGYIATVALRFLPALFEEYAAVRQARDLRGPRTSVLRRPWRRLRGELAIVGPVLASGVRRSALLATAVATRGFDPHAPRTDYPPLKMRPFERLMTMLLVAGAVGLTTFKSLYWLHLGGRVSAPALDGVYRFAQRWL
jgi:energy-coupling factor transport system permease protein